MISETARPFVTDDREDRDIQVSGRTGFPGSRWREAVLFYLFGIWGNREDVTYRPKIHFGDICLRLDRQSKEYYAYGHAEVPELTPITSSEETLFVRSGQNEVEIGLIRFVKDNRIKKLVLSLGPGGACQLLLWKKEKRSEYGVAGIRLPYSWGTKGAIWTREEYQKGDWWK